MKTYTTLETSDYQALKEAAEKYHNLIYQAEAAKGVIVINKQYSGYRPEWECLQISGEGEMFDALKELIDAHIESAKKEKEKAKYYLEEYMKLTQEINMLKKGVEQKNIQPKPKKRFFLRLLKIRFLIVMGFLL